MFFYGKNKDFNSKYLSIKKRHFLDVWMFLQFCIVKIKQR